MAALALENRMPNCHGAAMTPPPANRAPKAGGVLLALAIIVGVLGGGLLGEPSIGFLVGFAVGVLLVALVWLIDRRRT